jgi:hypothetical protein
MLPVGPLRKLLLDTPFRSEPDAKLQGAPMSIRRVPAVALCLTLCLAPPAAPQEAPEVLLERWDVAYVGDDRIGYFHTLARRLEVSGKPVVHTRQQSSLSIRRFGSQMKMEALADYYELEDGRLYATDAVTRISNEASTSRGRLQPGGKFHVAVDSKGAKLEQTLDWPPNVLGPYAQEQSLRTKPLAPGQTRSFAVFLPEMNVVATRRLDAKQRETTPLLDGASAELLRVVETNDKVDVQTSLWLDEHGEVVKSLMPIGDLQLSVYRADRSLALADAKPAAVDVGLQTLVKPDKPVAGAHAARAVAYRLTLGDASAADAIPAASYQKILARDGDSLRVRIERAQPDEDHPLDNPEPGPEFLESNVYIQPDHPKIRAVAESVAKGAGSDWEKAVRLERWVEANMTNQDFSIGFAPSSEVIETRQGDCTEHAVLLAALCRALGLPARVAMGLVWLDGAKSFGYHMWTEVFIAGDWYPIDGTIGRGGLGGGHIKIADSALQGVDANSAFLPIFKVIGKLKIQVERIDPS